MLKKKSNPRVHPKLTGIKYTFQKSCVGTPVNYLESFQQNLEKQVNRICNIRVEATHWTEFSHAEDFSLNGYVRKLETIPENMHFIKSRNHTEMIVWPPWQTSKETVPVPTAIKT